MFYECRKGLFCFFARFGKWVVPRRILFLCLRPNLRWGGDFFMQKIPLKRLLPPTQKPETDFLFY